MKFVLKADNRPRMLDAIVLDKKTTIVVGEAPDAAFVQGDAGDYLITLPDSVLIMKKDIFEAQYERAPVQTLHPRAFGDNSKNAHLPPTETGNSPT